MNGSGRKSEFSLKLRQCREAASSVTPRTKPCHGQALLLIKNMFIALFTYTEIQTVSRNV